MFWGSGGAVCVCKGGICKPQPAESGALALTNFFVVFLGETPFVMSPWVCHPATNSAAAPLPVGSPCLLWNPGNSGSVLGPSWGCVRSGWL